MSKAAKCDVCLGKGVIRMPHTHHYEICLSCSRPAQVLSTRTKAELQRELRSALAKIARLERKIGELEELDRSCRRLDRALRRLGVEP